MKRNMTCIICPRGCSLIADVVDSNISVTGNACPKGQEYAVNECMNPVRTVTATVRIYNRNNTMVSVKTANPVPKSRMLEVMARLRNTQIEAPAQIGDVVLTNVFGTDVIVTKDIL